jgi:hypothetical protein
MGSLKAKQLLFKAAKYLEKERANFSRQEIVKKVNEIKYLSSQKKVPRLTLRKEIIHLENKLAGVIDLEKKLNQTKKHEAKRVTSLKKQITNLKKRLAVCEDKEMKKKVEKLSHLLGEFLAKHGSQDDVELSKKVLKEIKIKDKELKKKLRAVERKTKAKSPKHARHAVKREEIGKRIASLSEDEVTRVKELQKRLVVLKQELLEVESLSPEQVQLMEQRANLIEIKLNQYYNQHPELLSVEGEKSEVVESPIKAGEVKHTLLMGQEGIPELSKTEEEESEGELPLPPPPRMTE